MMLRRLASLFILSLFALPVFVVPLAAIPAATQKGMLVALLFGLCAVAASIPLAFSKERLPILSVRLLAGLPLLFTALVSSSGHAVSDVIVGKGFEMQTVGILFLFVTSMCAAGLVRTRVLRIGTLVFLGAVSLAGLFTLAEFFFVGLPGDTLSGTWEDFAFFAGAALVLSSVYAHISHGWEKIVFLCTSAGLALCMALFFSPVALFVALCTLALTIGALLMRPERGEAHAHRAVPVVPLVVMGMLIAVLAVGPHMARYRVVSAPHPSILAMELVIGDSYSDNVRTAFLGTGEKFTYAWHKYQPIEANTSALWSTPPVDAGSTVLSLVVQWGFLGILALLFFLILVGNAFYRTMNHSTHEATRMYLPFGAFAFFLCVSLFVYAASAALFIIAGIASASLIQLTLRDDHREVEPRRATRVLCGFILLCVGVLLCVVTVRQLVAAEFFARAAQDQVGRGTTKVRFLELASGAWPTATYMAELSRAVYTEEVIGALRTGSGEALESSIQRALKYADGAKSLGRTDISTWLFVASLKISLVGSGVPDLEDSIHEGLGHASRLGPLMPEVPYLEALLAIKKQDPSRALLYLKEALRRKPDYEDALQLQKQIQAQVASMGVPVDT